MPLPFRNPISSSSEGAENEEWSPPDYAQPVEDKKEEWKPPSYATPVGAKKEEKKGALSRFVESVKPPKSQRLPFELPGFLKAKVEKPAEVDRSHWDLRPDKTQKGDGYLGVFKLPDGVASEFSIADSEKLKDEKGNYLDYPTLVPTLTKEEVQAVLKSASDKTKKTPLPNSVYDKAEAHALKRKSQGLPIFATPGEEDYSAHPDIERASHYDPNAPRPEQKGFLSSVREVASKFLTEHPKIREVGQRFLTGTSPEFEESLRKQGITSVQGPELMKIPGLAKATDYLSQKITGSEGTGRLAAGAVVKAVGDLLEGGFDPRTAGLPKGELPIRRSREIPYRMEEPPKPPTPKSEISVKQKVADYLKKNPDAKMEDVEKFVQSVTPTAKTEDVVNAATKAEASKPENVAKIQEIKNKVISQAEKAKTETPTEAPKPPIGRVAQIQKERKIPFSEAKRIADEEAAQAAKTVKKSEFINPFEKKPEETLPLETRPLVKKFGRVMSQDEASPIHRATDYTAEPERIRVPANKVVATQEGFQEPIIERYRQEPGSELPTASKMGDEYILSEGHHRALAQMAEGANEIELNAYPVNEELARNPQPQLSWMERMKPAVAGKEESVIKPKAAEGWKPPEYATPVEKTVTGGSGESAASQEAINRQTSMKSKGQQYVVYDRAGNERPLIGPDAVDYVPRPGETYGIRTARGFRTLEDKGGKIPPPTEMHGGLGGISPPPGDVAFTGRPESRALNKLFTGLEGARGKIDVEKQAAINRAERARRFAAFESVGEEGAAGAFKSLGKLKGEFEKVPVAEHLSLKPEETDSLFTAIKRANITTPEKARGITALAKLLNGEGVPVRSELKVLDDVFGNGFADKITEMHGGIGAVGLKLTKTAATMKSMQNALSLAAPLRHGIGLAGRREFYPAFADMFRFFGNKEYYNSAMKAIQEGPNYLLGRDAGLFLSSPGSLQGAEEEFLNSYAGSIPGVRNVVGASQRAYTGFLNKLRSDVFDSMIKQAESLGNKTNIGGEATNTTRAISRFINNATGRGSLGSLNKMTNELNTLFWSPRMIASRVTMLTNPKIYMDLPKGMRLEGLKSLLGITALGTTIDTLAAFGGAKVSSNILSTDFGKSRFGTKLIDPWGGFQQYIVAAARFLAGKTDSPRPETRLDIGERFLANKLSPAASLAHNILTAKKFEGGGAFKTQYGQETSVQREVAKQFEPIFLQDLQELATSEPDWSENIGLTAALGAASLTGMEQSYPERKTGKLGFRKMQLR